MPIRLVMQEISSCSKLFARVETALEAHSFDSWILKSKFIGESGAMTFTSIVDMQFFYASFPILAGKMT
jgi:hypothetical protein